MKKGLFLTMEGPDGCGKTTQARLLVDFLRKNGLKVLHTREPGGTSFAENLRKILLDPNHKIIPLSELMIYEASRAQHTEEVIRPALKRGEIIICERYTDATYAYQGYGRKLEMATIEVLNRIATHGLQPYLTILLDISAKEGLKRARENFKNHHPLIKEERGGEREGEGDRFEQESLSFHTRVKKGYLALAKEEPERIKIVSAEGTIEEVQKRVREVVRRYCELF